MTLSLSGGPSLGFRAVSLAVLVSLTSSLVTPALHAQDAPRAENIAAARALGVQGIQLADAGQCDKAIEKLSRAEALYHAPTILGRLGECQVQVGQIVLGTENLNRVIREQLPANAPRAFRDSQDRAQKVLAKAQPRIAYLTVRLEPASVRASVTVGGAPVPHALIGAERPTDPGTHEVVATAPGHLTSTTSVTLAEGSRQEVALKLEPDPNAVAATAPTAAPAVAPPQPSQPAAAKPADAPPKKSKTLAYVFLGLGAAGVAVGSVTGVMAMSKKGDLSCTGKQCPLSEDSKLESAKSMATISTVGFGVGLASAALGTILLIVAGKSSETAASNEPDKASLTPWLGYRAAGVSGAF